MSSNTVTSAHARGAHLYGGPVEIGDPFMRATQSGGGRDAPIRSLGRKPRPRDPRVPVLRLRPTTLKDLDLLVNHRQRMWRDIGRWKGPELVRASPVYRRWVRREVRAGRFYGFLVETEDGNPAGSGAIWLQPSQPRPGKLARLEMPYILSMYTEPTFQSPRSGLPNCPKDDRVGEVTRVRPDYPSRLRLRAPRL